MAKLGQPLNESDIKAIISAEIAQALGRDTDRIAGEREKALDYYFGLPFGNEQEDRSQVVLTDVRDAIESIMPQLMKIFLASGEIVEFEPQGPEDEQSAKQATDYVNYVMTRDNPIFHIMYTWCKDGLLSKLGVVTWRWKESINVTEERYQGQNQVQLAALLSDPDVEVISYQTTPIEGTQPSPEEQAEPEVLYDVVLKRTSNSGRVEIINIQPEKFLISSEARDIENARFVGYESDTTPSNLIADGFDPALVERLPKDESSDDSGEDAARRSKDSGFDDSDSVNHEASRRVRVIDGYYRIDADGDGIAELRHIVSSRDGTIILLNEIFNGDRPPFAAFSPLPTPHRVIGLSVADMVMDAQLIKSTLLRGILDNAYTINNTGYIVYNPERVNMDDLLTPRPNRIIRAEQGAQIEPLSPPGVIGPTLYPIMEYMDSVKEQRVGAIRYNQGLDADSLNHTATGVNRLMDAAQDRILLLAQIIAEYGVTNLAQGVLQTILQNKNAQRIVRLRGQWVTMDPRTWSNKYDVRINVGLGTGSHATKIAALSQLLQVQEKIIASGGLNQLVTLKNIHNTVTRLIEAIGLKGADQYVTDPETAQQPAQPQEKPDPKMVEIEKKYELEAQKLQADSQIRMREIQVDAELKKYQIDQEIALRQQQAGAEIITKANANNVRLGGMPG